jgi:hypothetical protein
VHAAAQVDEPVRTLDKRREQVRGEHVDGQHIGMAIDGGDLAILAVADAGVVDDRVEAAERVDLVGDRPGLSRATEVADSRIGHAGRRVPQVSRAADVTRVPDDLVPLAQEQRHGGQAQAIASSGNEHPRHGASSPTAPRAVSYSADRRARS